MATNEEWHYRPPGAPWPMPWCIVLKWRISNPAGFEGGTKIHVNTIDPWELRRRAVAALREAIQVAVLTAPRQRREALIHDYPDMAQLITAPEEEHARISRDRGSLGLEDLDDAQLAALLELAAQYRERFGMPWVAYLSTTDSVDRVLRSGVRRLANSAAQEHRVALTQIVEIANDRFDALLAGANPVRASWDRKFTELD